MTVADLYDAKKRGIEGLRLPRQVILQYVWRERVTLTGARFGEYDGETTTMLCGGTLVFDETGSVLWWARKPGTEGGTSDKWKAEIAEGEARRDAFLDDLARRIQAGQVGAALGSSKGLLGTHVPPVQVKREHGTLRFELSPHLNLSGENHEDYIGGHRWEVSS